MTSQDPQTGIDAIDRLFRRLVLNLAQLDRSRLDAPIPLVEIHQNLVPYRTHRAVLGIDTNQDYEMTVLRLLAGEGDLAGVEPAEVRAIIEREAGAVNPETGVFRRFPSATVRLAPDRVHDVLAGTVAAAEIAEMAATVATPAPEATPAAVPFVMATTDEVAPAADDEGPDQADLPFSLAPDTEDAPDATPREITTPGAQCGYCGGELPVGRSVIFCPHCGQNVGVMHCSVCGTELDVGWRFCITCGREMAGLG